MQLPVVGESSVDLPEVDPAHDNTDLTCKVCLVMPMVAVRGVANTFQLGFEACSTEGDPYLVLNQMPRSEEAIATLILPNRPIIKLHSKCLIFVYTHCSLGQRNFFLQQALETQNGSEH